jgi:hypothetical protein
MTSSRVLRDVCQGIPSEKEYDDVNLGKMKPYRAEENSSLRFFNPGDLVSVCPTVHYVAIAMAISWRGHNFSKTNAM